ncbi:hypothetical protein ACFL1Y_01055 [Patescibacteria group bacterium]
MKERRERPEWPKIARNTITPNGFDNEEGDKPCFAMEYNRCYVYIPHSFISDYKTAKSIFKQILPTLDEMWPDCGDRHVVVNIQGKKEKLFLYFAFSHILVKKQNDD